MSKYPKPEDIQFDTDRLIKEHLLDNYNINRHHVHSLDIVINEKEFYPDFRVIVKLEVTQGWLDSEISRKREEWRKRIFALELKDALNDPNNSDLIDTVKKIVLETDLVKAAE
jgi:hypothetical protein